MLIFLPKDKIDIIQRMIITLCIISIPFFQSLSKRYSKTNLKIDIPSENIHFRIQVYKGKNYFILPKVASHSLNKYMDNERIWQWEKTYITSNPQPIGFSGILLAKRQNSFYCTYFLHNRNVADTKSPYPIKRLEVIRWFNQKSMVFNQSLS